MQQKKKSCVHFKRKNKKKLLRSLKKGFKNYSVLLRHNDKKIVPSRKEEKNWQEFQKMVKYYVQLKYKKKNCVQLRN